MAHRKEEGGWHIWVTGSLGAGEPKAGDKGDQDEVGLGEASHHLEGFPTICWCSFCLCDSRWRERRGDMGERPVPCQPWQCREKKA